MNTTGVIVGRFQTPRLTPGHVHLINTALLQNDEVILFIGSSPMRNSFKNPIPFVWRQSMIQADRRLFREGKNLHILELPDRGDDKVWSNSLHNKILQVLSQKQDKSPATVRLYGSRDSSFLTGFDISNLELPYEKVELLPFSNFLATTLREQVANKFPSGNESDDLIREGMVICSQMRFPMVISTVDIAILQIFDGVTGVWLGRKPNQDKFRFIGGFTDPKSLNDEEDAIREAEEETNLIVRKVRYIGNATINDWRLSGEPDKIRTRFFVGWVEGSTDNLGPKAKDDIAELKWVPIEDLKNNPLVSEHGPLQRMFLNWVDSKEN